MATMDMLIKEIYFERQQEGSMLCAQHALNSLLQAEYFTAPDLAAIAKRLDELESGYDDANLGDTSTNMDDTGFFSIQVIEEALKPWSLSLRRWRSEVMLPYHDKPHCQLAFILNSQQHWYTLRRFGEAVSDFTQDPGAGHWFNLNSFNEHPLWIGKTYLDMTLQQAEEVGYSVFAVVQDDPTKPLALPRSDADHLAAFLTEDARPSAAYRSGESNSSTSKAQHLETFDDEDAELQAALQASISGHAYPDLDSLFQPLPPPAASSSTSSTRPTRTPRTPRTPIQGARTAAALPPLRRPTIRDFEMISDEDDEDDDSSDYPPVIPPRPDLNPALPLMGLDPLEASRARSQAYMQQVMREQEAALRESRAAEAAAVEAGYRPTRRGGRDRRDEQEEEELRRAIEASLAAHPGEAQGSGSQSEPIAVDEEDAGDEEVEYLGSSGGGARRETFPRGDRVYDDEDAELQAALRASLADVPPGFEVPDTPPRAAPPVSLPAPSVPASSVVSNTGLPPPSQDVEDDLETESEADTTVGEEGRERELVSVEEMRRRRLARFGG